jgi:hypothetical protein
MISFGPLSASEIAAEALCSEDWVVGLIAGASIVVDIAALKRLANFFEVDPAKFADQAVESIPSAG